MKNSKLQLKIKNYRNFEFPTSIFNFKLLTFKFTQGQALVEILIALGLTAIFLPALITGFITSRQGKAQQNRALTAYALLKEGAEAARNARDDNWETFANNGTFYPAININGSWQLISSASGEETGGYQRKVEISSVYRDLDGTIISSGTPDQIDPSTKRVEVIVSWDTPFPNQVSSTTYLSRWRDNIPYTETTQTDFNNGLPKSGTSGVAVEATLGTGIPDDGQVILGAGGSGDWCAPGGPKATLNLTGQGIAKGVLAIEGRAFVGTGQNASGHALYNVTISNPPKPTPPAAKEEGIYDDSGLKTNGVFGERIDTANFGYIATDKNSEEVVILNVNPNTPVKIGSIDTPGPQDASSVFVSNDMLFVTVESTLYRYLLNSNRTAATAKGSIPLPGIGNKVFVVNGYAFVAIGSTTKQLQIVNATDPNTLSLAGSLTVNNRPAQDIFVKTDGTRAYLVTSVSAGSPEEFFIINSENVNSLSVIGKYNTNYQAGVGDMDPKGVTIVTGNKAIIVGTGGEEYQALLISDESAPTHCGGLNNASTDTGINGVSSVLESDGDAWSYIITQDAGAELQIIEGGPGGQHATDGTFESQTFDRSAANYKTAFNRIDFTFSETAGSTDIKFQVAVAEEISNSCSDITFTYVGPGGDQNAYFEDDGPLPYGSFGATYKNPGNCFSYKAFLSTTDPSFSPTLYDATVNYSP